MKWHQVILAFIATICMIFTGSALAQTDININNTNLIRFGGSVTVPENQVVENALAFGGNVTVSPNAKVVDTAIAFGGDVILQKEARVEGDAYSFGGKIVQEPSAIVSGERATFSDRHGMMYGVDQGRSSFFAHYFFSAIFRISAAIAATILGLIILHTSPQFLPNLATKLRQHPSLTALWGIGAIVAIIFVSVFLAITLIGIPLIPLLILTAIVTSLVGSLGVALFVGQRLVSSGDRSLQQQFLVGLAILTVLALIPFFGGLVVFLVNLFGLGIILLWKFGREKPQTATD
ncbi:hypothetical protein C7B65_08195 [Phormidesmis priestleyi ULC007]|uniref:DUF8173 domain-containing protein n=1 Tax=Phormidesmis priestleyi ULC007 TaxID=1920490 RepID=A0A2T1DJ11_9CYAN|nr:hypothetical protein [Phormidesmis priestleyi]PSB20445.1 hypothetical protein C7B65_08195 [Phormidesmis priestleyi ULC007]PZO53154.1 MAG: hypothetical protein DCF14_05025 [Phormidesmis priestleyi]